LAPVGLSAGSFDRLIARLDDDAELIHAGSSGQSAPSGEGDLPWPLRAYVPGRLADLPWKHYGSVSEAPLALDETTYRTRLIVLKAGRAVPKHTHDGQEITVVLKGAFNDGIGRYGRGDLSIADAHVDHQPMAEPGEDCLCLTVTDAPLRLTGTFSRFLNPFVRL